jgi:hypothetical protein
VLALPLPATDPIRLADWLELSALVSSDRDASIGDLERTLTSAGVLQAGDAENPDDVAGPEATSTLCLEVFQELEARAAAAQDGYPFQLNPRGLVRLAGQRTEFSPYIFCLCLSYSRFNHMSGSKSFPRRHFEDLACIAAQNYLQGESVRFASPRSTLAPKFYPALNVLCSLMKEGGPHKKKRERRAGQDAKLDVVAWRHFPDRQPGKIMLFGQCASGADWEDKLGELNPDAFCKSWLSEQPISPMVRAFFIPHRVDHPDWEDVCRQAGIVFDRCRIAYWVHRTPAPADAQKYVDATRELLDRLRP